MQPKKTHFMKQKLLALIVAFTINVRAQVTDVLTSGLDEPAGVAISGNFLYIAEAASNKISKIDISLASPVKSDVVSGLSRPDGLFIQGNTLYISEYGFTSSTGKISKIDITSSAPSLTTVIENLPEPTGITIDGNSLYIAEYHSGKISKVNLQTLVKTDFLSNLSGPTGLFIDGNILYFSQFDINKISKVDMSQAVPTVIDVTDNLNEPAFLTGTNLNLYLADYGSGKILDANKNEITNSLQGPYGITNNGTFAFFSQRDGNKISKFNLNTLSTDDIEKNSNLSVYPNPSSDFILIKNAQKNSEIIIYDLSGKIVYQSLLINDKINIQNLEKGNYIIKLNNQTVKFVKK